MRREWGCWGVESVVLSACRLAARCGILLLEPMSKGVINLRKGWVEVGGGL